MQGVYISFCVTMQLNLIESKAPSIQREVPQQQLETQNELGEHIKMKKKSNPKKQKKQTAKHRMFLQHVSRWKLLSG